MKQQNHLHMARATTSGRSFAPDKPGTAAEEGAEPGGGQARPSPAGRGPGFLTELEFEENREVCRYAAAQFHVKQ